MNVKQKKNMKFLLVQQLHNLAAQLVTICQLTINQLKHNIDLKSCNRNDPDKRL